MTADFMHRSFSEGARQMTPEGSTPCQLRVTPWLMDFILRLTIFHIFMLNKIPL